MFFKFEADFVESLRCIPMQVRLKLDTCGIKLKLPEWHLFTQEERQTLVDSSCVTDGEIEAYRQILREMVLRHTGKPATDLAIQDNPPWLDGDNMPIDLLQKVQDYGLNLTIEQWQNLQPEQRFALIKLSRSNHENSNFIPALEEFSLIP